MKQEDKAQRFKSIRTFVLSTLMLGTLAAGIGGCVDTSTQQRAVSFQFVVTDDSRAAGGGAVSPGPSAGFGQSNLAQNNGVSTAVMAAIAKDIAAQNANSKIDFVLFPGDMITGEDQDSTHLSSEMDTWKTTMAPVYNANIPIYTTRGNHEYAYTSGVGAMNPADPSLATYKIHFPLAAGASSPTGSENGLTYSFTYKNAKFIAFDQYANRTLTFDNTKYALGANEGQMLNPWVLDEIYKSTAGVNFVMAHEQMWPSTSHPDCLANDPISRDALVGALGKKNGAYFAGHDHMYVRGVMNNGIDRVPAFVVGTGGGGNYDFAPFDVVAKGYTGASKYTVQKALSNSKNPQFGYLLVTVYTDNTWSGQFRGFQFNNWNSATDVSLTPFTVLDSFKSTEL